VSPPVAAVTFAFRTGSYSSMPSVGIRTSGFILRAFLIQSARYAAVFGKRPAAMVLREPMCVRLGPAIPIAAGLPAMEWQPMHAELEKTCFPRAALPV